MPTKAKSVSSRSSASDPPPSSLLPGARQAAPRGVPEFVEADAPNDDDLPALLQTVIAWLMKMLTRLGVLVEDMGQTSLADSDDDAKEPRSLRPRGFSLSNWVIGG
jgi:hypothetical protein